MKNIVKRRGISYLDDANEDGESSSSEYGKAVEENRKLLADKTPGQIQLERFEKYGQDLGLTECPPVDKTDGTYRTDI